MARQPQTHRPETDTASVGWSLKKRGWFLAALQMAALLLSTVLLETFDVDRRVAAHFYRAGNGWYLAKAPIWAWLYAYGTIPGLVLTLGALAVCLGGFYVQRLKVWRKPCLVVVLTTVIAAGLLVNVVLKQYWGRPRPDQTIEFGGKWAYRPIFPPGQPGKGASFPCGHCTMGFVFLAMAVFHRRSKILAAGGITVGAGLGMLLSAARIVQGAHFLSDTIWSLGIVTMTATILYAHAAPFSTQDHRAAGRPMTRRRRIWVITAAAVGSLVLAGGFLTRRPYYNTMVYPLRPAPAIEEVRIHINADPERVTVRHGGPARLQVDAHGFGWLKFNYRMGFEARIEGRSLNISLDAQARSYFAELDHAITLTLPGDTGHRVAVMVNDRPVDSSRP